MRVEHVVYFRLHELPEEVQEKAHENYLNQGHEIAWADENRQSMEEFCKVFPVDAKDWQYGLCQLYVTPRMRYSEYADEVWDMTGLRLRTWLLNNFDGVLWKGKYFSLTTNTSPYRYVHRYSKAIIERASCPFTGYCMDDNLMDPIHKFIEKPDSRTLEDLLSECLWTWIHACQSEVEHQNSFEYFKDAAEINEWEFDQHGKMI